MQKTKNTTQQAAQRPPNYPNRPQTYASSFARYLRTKGRASGTIRLYQRTVEKYIRFLEDDLGFKGGIENATREHAEVWIDRMIEHGLSPLTIRLARQGIYVFYHWLVDDQEELKVNPVAKVRTPKPDVKIVQALRPEQQKALLKAAGDTGGTIALRNKALVAVMLDSGLRSGEVCALNRDRDDADSPVPTDLNMDQATLFIRHSKTHRQRVIGLGDKVVLLLEKYLRKRQDGHEALFVTTHKRRFDRDSLHSLIKRLGEHAGIDGLHPHVLRHTAATNAANVFTPEDAMRRHFGWAPGSPMVSHYTATGAEERTRRIFRQQSAVDKLLS
jgi:site-specific recombinase XerD